jgi:5-methylcytosine-specific restriction endonuclease McrA
MSDVGTTERKRLTPSQRLKLFEKHKGTCALCGLEIKGKRWVVEHMRPLGLGGTNEVDENLRPVHEACAREKTIEDVKAIARAKRIKMRAIGIETSGKKIQSRGFVKREKQNTVMTKIMPRKPMYQ